MDLVRKPTNQEKNIGMSSGSNKVQVLIKLEGARPVDRFKCPVFNTRFQGSLISQYPVGPRIQLLVPTVFQGVVTEALGNSSYLLCK